MPGRIVDSQINVAQRRSEKPSHCFENIFTYWDGIWNHAEVDCSASGQ